MSGPRPSPVMHAIRPAAGEGDLAVVRRLFREYAQDMGINLCFQNFDAELASLPGKYAPPGGRLLLAWRDAQAVGCVALRPIDGERCEMKRLYVQPEARGRGLGEALVERICAEGRAAGYRQICLDTLAGMPAAVRLYERLGFERIGPYVFNPLPDAIFLARALRA